MDLETLKEVKRIFELCDDDNTEHHGYNSLCTLIKTEEEYQLMQSYKPVTIVHQLPPDHRKLTGRWYLKKKLFGYYIMVETIQTTTCISDFSVSPEFIRWEKAKDRDFIDLGINFI